MLGKRIVSQIDALRAGPGTQSIDPLESEDLSDRPIQRESDSLTHHGGVGIPLEGNS
jgi:hypothetical protein